MILSDTALCGLCGRSLSIGRARLNTSQLATVRADPGHGVTAYTPLVFLHARQTDLKAAVAGPAEFVLFSATMTVVLLPFFFSQLNGPLHHLLLAETMISLSRDLSSKSNLNIVDWNQNIG